MGGAIFLVYLAVAVIVALILSRKTDRVLLSFVFVCWMLTQPVINAFFVYKLPGLNFDLRLNRLLFFFAFTYILSGSVLGRAYAYAPATAIRRPFFEKYFYIYAAAIALAIALNYSAISSAALIATPLEIVTFIMVYTAAKRYATASVLESILKAALILSVFSAFVAIVQFGVDPLFMRTGEAKAAFGETLRAFGIFQFDGEFGTFQILSLVVVLLRFKGALRFTLVVLLLLSIFVTFHRLSYLTLFVCLMVYSVFFSKQKTGAILLIMIPLVLALSYSVYKSMHTGSIAVEQRLGQDTVSGRIEQYKVTLDAIKNHPLGLGSYENPTYVKLMLEHDMVQWLPDSQNRSHPEALEVHNGYLDVGIKYGVLGVATFVALMVSMLRYFKKRVTSQSRYSIVPFFAVLIWMMSNTTQTNSNFRGYFLVLMAIICGSFVAQYRSRAVEVNKKIVNTGASAVRV